MGRLRLTGLLLGALVTVAACTSGGTSGGQSGVSATAATTSTATPPATSTAATSTAATGAASTSTAAPTTSTAPSATEPTPTYTGPKKGSGTSVHLSSLLDDGRTYGVAMPIIVFFSEKVTDAKVFDQVATVKVNGKAVKGAWYWEHSSRSSDEIEAHFRLPDYWPAHADIDVDLPVKGLWAGQGKVFANDMTLAVHTGAAHVVKINGRPGVDSLKAYSDGELVRTAKVSLGKSSTPTYIGTAVTMAKTNPELMQSAPGSSDPYKEKVPYSVRVTYSGEFLHAASWNGNIGSLNTSHGCTNLEPAVAEWYYGWSLIGDPVTWRHTGSSRIVPVTDGWGEWNLSWTRFSQGGLLAND